MDIAMGIFPFRQEAVFVPEDTDGRSKLAQ